MTTRKKNQSSGPPQPTIELTLEQKLKLRQMELLLNKPQTKKEDAIIVLLALQKQAFVLGNCIQKLLDKWPIPPPTDPTTTDEDLLILGILLDNKNLDSTSET